MCLVSNCRRAISCGCLAAGLALAGLWLFAAPTRVDPRGWNLADLVDHLHERGLHLKVVPSRRDGEGCDNLYLTRDAALTWQSFQLKPRTVHHLEQWRG